MASQRRSLGWVVALAVALVAMLVAGVLVVHRTAAHADPVVLRVASQKGGTKALFLASGALEGVPYTIEWSEFPAAQHLLEALGAGAVDVGAVGDAPFHFAYQSGSPIKAVQAIHYDPQTPATAILVRSSSPVRRDRELRG